MSKICHKLIAATARNIAAEVYEACASNNKFYKEYPSMDNFVERQWSYFIGDARKCLLTMLKPKTGCDPNNPEYYYSQHIRDEIFEALCLEGEAKAAPLIDVNKLRESAGFQPLPRPLPMLS
jgi:hypothetical protein